MIPASGLASANSISEVKCAWRNPRVCVQKEHVPARIPWDCTIVPRAESQIPGVAYENGVRKLSRHHLTTIIL